jgi:hypothetical protein
LDGKTDKHCVSGKCASTMCCFWALLMFIMCWKKLIFFAS